MATLFTRIIEGELPARFVWQDDTCVAFLSINPLREGHTLVVPREEVDHWIDASPDVLAHLMLVARTIGEAQQRVFEPARVGLMIAGMEVPHLHLHVAPIDSERDLDFANADRDPGEERLDAAAERLREGLRGLGHAEHVPS